MAPMYVYRQHVLIPPSLIPLCYICWTAKQPKQSYELICQIFWWHSECFMYTTISIYMYLHCWIALHLTSFSWLHVTNELDDHLTYWCNFLHPIPAGSYVGLANKGLINQLKYTYSLDLTLQSSCCINYLFFFILVDGKKKKIFNVKKLTIT